MKLGELKKSLSRFPEDMDDADVLFTFIGDKDKDKIEYDNLAFVAYAEMGDNKETTIIMLGSMKVAIERMKKGTLHYADGTKLTDSGFDLSDSK